MSSLFVQNGYDIPHEKMGRHGTSNWQMIVHALDYPFPGDPFVRQDIQFDHHFHVYRDPLLAIESVAFTERRSEYFRERYVNLYGNEFERAVLSLTGWNKMARSQMAWPVILEDAPQMFGLDYCPGIVNARDHDAITERELQALVSNDIYQLYLIEKQFYNDTRAAAEGDCYRHIVRSVRFATKDA